MTQVSSIRTAIAFGRSRALLATLLLVVACGEDAKPNPDAGGPDVLRCEYDDSEGIETAVALTDEATGTICPKEDEDWYVLSVGADTPIVHIRLAMNNARTPIEVTYDLWSTAGGEPDTAIPLPNPEAVGGPLNNTYHLEAGDYFIVVRDQGDDMEDLRNRYTLGVTLMAQPDSMEPNDTQEAATPVTSGDEVTGYIASSADEDWYAVEVPAGSVIRITLTMPDSEIDPAVALLDPNGELIVEDQDRAADGSDSRLLIVRVLAEGGTYYVVVNDYAKMNGDSAIPYQLLIEVVQDRDDNEPNDHPSEATDLGAVNCAADWTDLTEFVGTVGSPGDNDWYALTLSNCVGGVIEATVELGGDLADGAAWELQQDVQASVTLVRDHADSPCAAGDDGLCKSLTLTCDNDPEILISWDCEGYFNSCAGDGLCTGATVCLPTGNCGANQTQRSYEAQPPPATIDGPPDNTARLSAPLLADGTYYLRVSDFQADGGDPEALYTIRTRVRIDPDPGDAKPTPNNPYGNRLTDDALPIEQGVPRAATVLVNDAGGCAAGVWSAGALSYENDMDFFRYDHPCPPPAMDPLAGDGDCLLKLNYEVDAGAVEPAIVIYSGNSSDNAFVSFPLAAGSSGSFGGVSPGNECFFAYRAHTDYTIMIVDQADDGRQWNSDQSYRFCLERASDACGPPCWDYGEDLNGCGPPCEAGNNCGPCPGGICAP